jgi:type II secretory pathway pseudopilin PulG
MKNKGFIMVEILLSLVIFSMIFITLFGTISFLQRRTERSRYDSQASSYVTDGMEIAHNALLTNWKGYADGVYSPAFDADSKSWILLPGEETSLATRFDRSITIESVCRDTITGERRDLLSGGACQSGKKDIMSKEVTVLLKWKEVNVDKKISATLLVFNANAK